MKLYIRCSPRERAVHLPCLPFNSIESLAPLFRSAPLSILCAACKLLTCS